MTKKVEYWYSFNDDDYMYAANSFNDAKETVLYAIDNEEHSTGFITQICNNVSTCVGYYTIEDTFYKVFKECEHVASFRTIRDAIKYAKQFDCFVYIESFEKYVIWTNF